MKEETPVRWVCRAVLVSSLSLCTSTIFLVLTQFCDIVYWISSKQTSSFVDTVTGDIHSNPVFNMSSPRERWGLSCTTGGRFYICEDDDTQFMGCCLSDPCGRNNGTCPDGDLRATTFESDTYAGLPAQDCDNSQGVDNWYTCAYTTPPFLGCCSQNACASGCPRNRLVPAKLSGNENNRLNFLNPRESGSPTSSTASETASATTSSTSGVEASDNDGLGTGAIAGIAIGAAVGGLIVLILLAWLFWWKPRQKKQQSETSIAYQASPAAPAVSQNLYSPMEGTFRQGTFNAQSPMSGYQRKRYCLLTCQSYTDIR